MPAMHNFILAFIFFLPAGLANMAPVFLAKLPYWSEPINEHLFGKNKTWRGLIAGILVGMFSGLILTVPWLAGALLGSGALLGDLVESYIKRRKGIAPGKAWWIADQVDWILGALVLTQWIFHWTPMDWILLLVVYGLLHPLANIVGYHLGLKSSKI